MPQAPAANDHQPDEHPHHHHHPEVAPARQVGKRLAHQLIEATGAQVALQEFQPGVRREANVIELQRQIPIDTGMQIGFSSSHGQWPFEGVGLHHLSTTLEGLFQSQSAIARSEK